MLIRLYLETKIPTFIYNNPTPMELCEIWPGKAKLPTQVTYSCSSTTRPQNNVATIPHFS